MENQPKVPFGDFHRPNPRARPLAILRLPAVKARIGLARSTIYDKLDINSPRYDSTFPKPVTLGLHAVGWVESEIHDWINNQIAQSRKEVA